MKANFSNFSLLEKFLKETDWHETDSNLENEIKAVIIKHLQLLSDNFEFYFPLSQHKEFARDMWVLNPFNNSLLGEETIGDMASNLIDLSQDMVQKSIFGTLSYGDFWVNLLKIDEYSGLATAALQKLVIMPTTYLSEKEFSCLVDLKDKKRNRLKCIDTVMRGALENLISPRYEKCAKQIQPQGSH